MNGCIYIPMEFSIGVSTRPLFGEGKASGAGNTDVWL